MLKRINFYGFVLILTSVLFSSCITRNQITYLQDMQHDTLVPLQIKYEAKIHPNDELTIYITSRDRSLADPFNIVSIGGGKGYSSMVNIENMIGYLVDSRGNIDMPVIGSLHVDGMTRLELQDTIAHILKEGGYLDDAVVMVRFKNYKIFVLSANGSQTLTVTNERVTLLDALAMCGDLTSYTRRDRVGVQRQEMDGIKIRYLNLKSKNVYNDPYFLLQQNDVILLEPLKVSLFKDNASWMSNYVTLTTSLVSIITLILTLIK